MPSTLDCQSALPRRQRRYGIARWWLAGLLVSCLLPANLGPADAFRNGERSITICLWVPAVLRAQSHWIAKDAERYVAGYKYPTVCPIRRLSSWLPPLPLLVAARDVLTQRGPPSYQFGH